MASSEVEALLLEHNLIKQHHPPFNIRLRDDKSYPYVVITLEDEYPRVMFTRQPHRRGEPLLRALRAARPRCARPWTSWVASSPSESAGAPPRGGGAVSPCLQFHIKRCLAPCVGAVTSQEYGW